MRMKTLLGALLALAIAATAAAGALPDSFAKNGITTSPKYISSFNPHGVTNNGIEGYIPLPNGRYLDSATGKILGE